MVETYPRSLRVQGDKWLEIARVEGEALIPTEIG